MLSPEDALRPAPDASYEAQLSRPYLPVEELSLASDMLGRGLRGRSAAAVRCFWQLPAVLRVDPALDEGTPFPTVFWLACPLANRHVGRLEASGVMSEWSTRLGAEPELAEAYTRAGHRYVQLRDRLGARVPRDPAAGGMPSRVKCLHALYGHYLATLDNVVGQWVAARVEPMPCPAPCVTQAGDGWKQRGQVQP